MPRPVAGALVMVREIAAVLPDAEFVWGDPDGIGRVRAITLDSWTSQALAPILDELVDGRIKSITSEGKGKKARTTITFVDDVRADFAHPYGVGYAYLVLTDPGSSVTDEEPQEGHDDYLAEPEEYESSPSH